VPKLKPTHLVNLQNKAEGVKKDGCKNMVLPLGPKTKKFSVPMREFGRDNGNWCPLVFHTVERLIHDLSGTRVALRIVIHCSAGVGRTGLFLGCLCVNLGFSMGEAIEIVEQNMKQKMSGGKRRKLKLYCEWLRSLSPHISK